MKGKVRKPRSVKETLEQALALFKGGKRWLKGDFAADKEGNSVEPKDPTAHSFCALGALQRIDGRFEDRATKRLSEVCEELYGNPTIDAVNDDNNSDYRTIARAFRHAIKSL